MVNPVHDNEKYVWLSQEGERHLADCKNRAERQRAAGMAMNRGLRNTVRLG